VKEQRRGEREQVEHTCMLSLGEQIAAEETNDSVAGSY
jgi:hypothetical protein